MKRKLNRKRMLKAAGKAPRWIQDISAAKRGTPKEYSRFDMRGFLKVGKRGAVRHFTPEEIAEYERKHREGAA
jgi:hypothetical protein